MLSAENKKSIYHEDRRFLSIATFIQQQVTHVSRHDLPALIPYDV